MVIFYGKTVLIHNMSDKNVLIMIYLKKKYSLTCIATFCSKPRFNVHIFYLVLFLQVYLSCLILKIYIIIHPDIKLYVPYILGYKLVRPLYFQDIKWYVPYTSRLSSGTSIIPLYINGIPLKAPRISFGTFLKAPLIANGTFLKTSLISNGPSLISPGYQTVFPLSAD